MPLNKFPKGIEVEQGAIISFTQPNGSEMPGVIREISSTEATVDFNHPLSGKILMIEVDIKDIIN
jgi:FKBP-type peptidyl-prolyl cis-trans isomerase SlpA